MSKYKKDEVVRGCVTGIERYGIFINLDEYYNGLVHISEISESYVKNITDYVNVGDTIFVKVVEEDQNNNQVKLSIKDIDYKKDGHKLIKIQETPSGFNNLKVYLSKWISNYGTKNNKK